MVSRTQLVCLCEGSKGRSVDPVFINALIGTLNPSWIRRAGSNYMRIEACGNRNDVVAAMPGQLKLCLAAGGDTTLMVWADCDDNCDDPEKLRAQFWKEAQANEITKEQFDLVVFILPKDRIENWIEFLATGNTDESKEGPRVKYPSEASKAAKKLAKICSQDEAVENLPPSLQWSCRNWRALVARMK